MCYYPLTSWPALYPQSWAPSPASNACAQKESERSLYNVNLGPKWSSCGQCNRGWFHWPIWLCGCTNHMITLNKRQALTISIVRLFWGWKHPQHSRALCLMNQLRVFFLFCMCCCVICWSFFVHLNSKDDWVWILLLNSYSEHILCRHPCHPNIRFAYMHDMCALPASVVVLCWECFIFWNVRNPTAPLGLLLRLPHAFLCLRIDWILYPTSQLRAYRWGSRHFFFVMMYVCLTSMCCASDNGPSFFHGCAHYKVLEGCSITTSWTLWSWNTLPRYFARTYYDILIWSMHWNCTGKIKLLKYHVNSGGGSDMKPKYM